MKCYYHRYNGTSSTCQGSFDECKELVECPTEGNFKPVCFALAKLDDDVDEHKNDSNNTSIKREVGRPKARISNAGCYSHDSNQVNCSSNQCLGDYRANAKNYYCCCTEPGCNGELIPKQIQQVITFTEQPAPPSNSTNVPESRPVINLVIPPVIIILVIVFVIALVYHRRVKSNRHSANNSRASDHDLDQHHHLHQLDSRLANTRKDDNNNARADETILMKNIHHEEKKFDLKDIKLLEVVGSGRFGTVHRATLVNSEIAVKIIPDSDCQSWQNELKIYNSSRTGHPNVLEFLGSCESPETNSNWLLVEYASNGSLHHYLKENPITWDQFLKISLGIVRGLSHLHDADVAHRDFKSKNVLLRHNLSPCITDFGVASMLNVANGSHNEQRKKYLQVGTPRYMAPEVLECSVSFTKISFTKIDVYALSLVLWELLSRCHPLPRLWIDEYDAESMKHFQQLHGLLDYRKDVVPPYKVPFEDVVGPNPDISAMRQVVVGDKIRPQIRPEWRLEPIAKLCHAIVDGWEYDHDARISASCFVERIELMMYQREQERAQS